MEYLFCTLYSYYSFDKERFFKFCFLIHVKRFLVLISIIHNSLLGLNEGGGGCKNKAK